MTLLSNSWIKKLESRKRAASAADDNTIHTLLNDNLECSLPFLLASTLRIDTLWRFFLLSIYWTIFSSYTPQITSGTCCAGSNTPPLDSLIHSWPFCPKTLTLSLCSWRCLPAWLLLLYFNWQFKTHFQSQFVCVLLSKIHDSLWDPAAAAAAAKSLQSCPTLCDPINGSPPSSPIPGILQARTLEWVAISFSNAWEWKVKVKSLSRVWLLATPWTVAHQAPPSMGFSRQEYWSGVPLPSPCETPSPF